MKALSVHHRLVGLLLQVVVLLPSFKTTTTSTCFVDAKSSTAANVFQALKDVHVDYRYFIAGGTCAAISHGITTPIDVVKTRIQANPKKYDKGMLAATVNIIQTEGPGTLLSGLGPTIVGYGVEGAMKFGIYEVAKQVFAAVLSDNSPLAFILASTIAGAVAALLLCPMESLRIRQVTDESYAQDSLLTGLPKLIRQDGFFSLFGGVWAMLAKQVPYTFGKQVSFDVIAATLYVTLAKFIEHVNKWVVSFSAAFCASIVACLFSQPGDMILTEIYKQGSGPDGGENFGKVVSKIYERGGWGEFFRGTRARIVHVGTIITSQLVIYDIVKQLLGLPATGSH